MSLRRMFRSVERAVRPVFKATAPALVRTIPGVGPVAAAALSVRQVTGRRSTAPTLMESPAAMSLLPGLVPAIGAAGRVAGRVAGAAGTAGGIYAGVQAMRGGGQARRRRTRKGISGSEMKAFERVTKVLGKMCKTPPPMRRRTSGGRKCR